jgi:predicted HicB family RNase H-like nuclease
MTTMHFEPGHRRIATALILTLVGVFLATMISGCGVFDAQSGMDGAVSPENSSGFVDRDMTTEESAKGTAESLVAPSGEPYSTDAADVPAEDRLVIRTVGMRVEVDDVDGSIEDLRKLAATYKAIVTDLQVSTDEDVPVYRYDTVEPGLADGAALSGYMTLRVPAESLEAFVDEAASLGKVLRQSENESDVTQEHIDLNARLKNLQAQEARLREFFDKATKVEEMLAIEQELGRVRGEIEAMQAQIAYLERQAALSTVTIELTKPAPVVRPSGTDWGFVDAITQSVRAFVGTINVMIILTGGILPLALLGLVVFLIIRVVMRRHNRKTHAGPQETSVNEPDQV